MRARPAPEPPCDRTGARSRGAIRLKSTRSLKCFRLWTQLRAATLDVRFLAQIPLVLEVLDDLHQQGRTMTEVQIP